MKINNIVAFEEWPVIVDNNRDIAILSDTIGSGKSTVFNHVNNCYTVGDVNFKVRMNGVLFYDNSFDVDFVKSYYELLFSMELLKSFTEEFDKDKFAEFKEILSRKIREFELYITKGQNNKIKKPECIDAFHYSQHIINCIKNKNTRLLIDDFDMYSKFVQTTLGGYFSMFDQTVLAASSYKNNKSELDVYSVSYAHDVEFISSLVKDLITSNFATDMVMGSKFVSIFNDDIVELISNYANGNIQGITDAFNNTVKTLRSYSTDAVSVDILQIFFGYLGQINENNSEIISQRKLHLLV